MNPTHSDHITNVHNAAKDFIVAMDKFRALAKQSTALDLPNNLEAEDFAGANAHLATVDITAVIGTTLPAIEALLAQGHATNLYKVA